MGAFGELFGGCGEDFGHRGTKRDDRRGKSVISLIGDRKNTKSNPETEVGLDGMGWGGVIGYWSLVIGYWLLVIGSWLLVMGSWLLVVGYWLLVICCWLLVLEFLIDCWGGRG